LLDFVETRTWCLGLDVAFSEFAFEIAPDLEALLQTEESVQSIANHNLPPFLDRFTRARRELGLSQD
jgi:hypothetical protein